MAVRRKYSDQERAEALAALAANGGNVYRTSRQLGIPRKNLERWAAGEAVHPDVAEMAHEKKATLAERFTALAEKLVGVADAKAHELNAKDAVIAAGVAVDKARLLQGESTPASITADVMAAIGQAIARQRARKPPAGPARGVGPDDDPVAAERGAAIAGV
jgi:hypothetical protein